MRETYYNFYYNFCTSDFIIPQENYHVMQLQLAHEEKSLIAFCKSEAADLWFAWNSDDGFPEHYLFF